MLCGGKNKPNIFLEDRRLDKSTDFKEEFIQKMIELGGKRIEREELKKELITKTFGTISIKKIMEALQEMTLSAAIPEAEEEQNF